ncbi:hypothetical protein CLV88_108100 [Shimia abyssi]|uniref:Uncharacterized protein n=1 Tax=Shimia abyssi TaxID=1662395 RepID=A0A2P8FB82_9RHOB|nr:hypothetical protein CLV88_108100 [Shimia abyssi]
MSDDSVEKTVVEYRGKSPFFHLKLVWINSNGVCPLLW